MAPSDATQPLLQGAREAVAQAAPSPSPLSMVPNGKSQDDIMKKKMKNTSNAAQKKAMSSLEAAREAARHSADAETLTDGTDVRVPMSPGGSSRGGSPRRRIGRETDRTLQLKEDAKRDARNFWMGIIFQVVLSVTCFALAVFIFADTKIGEKAVFLCFPVDRWLLAIAAIPPVYAVSRVLSSLLLMLSEILFAHMEHVHYVILGLWWPLTRLLSAIGLYMLIQALEVDLPPCAKAAKHGGKPVPPSVAAFMDESGAVSDDTTAADSRLFIDKICLCFVIFSSVALVSKLGCRLLSMRVTGDTLFEKLKDTVDQEQVLSQLMAPPEKQETDPSSPFVQALAELVRIPAHSIGHYLKDLHRLSLSGPYKIHESFAEQLTRLTKSFENMNEEELDLYAHNAAEYMWCTARRDPKDLKIVEADFATILDDPEDATFAYKLFDIDGDGFVLESEVHDRFEDIYRHRRNIAKTLVDTNDIINTLEALIGGIMHVIAVFAYLAIFGVNVQHLLISFSSVAVAFAFVFGNSLREIYESIVWLFIVNPYDEGDCLWYSNTFATVFKFGLLNTQLILTNGSMVWVPNQNLMGSGVTNLTRSKPVAVFMELEVDASVTPAAVEDLSQKMKAVAESDEALFDQSFEAGAHIQNVISPLKYQVELCYKTNTTMMQYSRYCAARAMMNTAIGAWIEEHGVPFSAPFQQAFNNPGPP